MLIGLYKDLKGGNFMGSKDRFKVDIQTLNNGVTGSCNFCVVKFPDGSTSRFVVDCGLFQGVDEEKDFNKLLCKTFARANF